MECFYPVQQRQVNTVFSRLPGFLDKAKSRIIDIYRDGVAAHALIGYRDAEPHTNGPKSDKWGVAAVYALMALNLPGFIGLRVLKSHAISEAKQQMERDRLSKFIIWLFPGEERKLRKRVENDLIWRAVEAYKWRWTVSPASWRIGKWYTWITGNFIHAEFGHLISNLLGLWDIGCTCAKRPCMGTWDLIAIAFGSCLSSSVANLVESSFYRDGKWFAFGASGMVYAFAAVAMLTDPHDQIRRNLGSVEISMSHWTVIPLYFLGDIVGLLQPLFTKPTAAWDATPRDLRIGHSAHLAGAVFGSVYYWMYVRPRTVRPGTAQVKKGENTG